MKKFFALGLALALSAALVGCGDAKVQTVTGPQETVLETTVETAPETAPETQPETQPETVPETTEAAETTEATEVETAYGEGRYCIQDANYGEYIFENGQLVLHYYEDENGKDSFTVEDGTIEFSPYYGWTVEQLLQELDSMGISYEISEME